MTWATRRQLIIVVIILGVLSLVTYYYVEPIINKPPTCSDGKQNGEESGIDCGGGCINLCINDVKAPIVLWQRSFQIAPSVYNAVAYVENQSKFAIQSIPYEFRLYDEAGVFVARVQNETLIPPLGRYAIVETGIKVGNAKIGKTMFDFGQISSPWLRVPENLLSTHVSIRDVKLKDFDTTPRLSAMVSNPYPDMGLRNIVISAILYDANDNAINVSKTLLPALGANVSAPIYFTWPNPITTPVVRYDIVPLIDIFHTTR